MTDNRTNEELAERLRQFAESQAMDFDSPYTAMMLNEVADRLVAAQGATPAQPSNGADEDVLAEVRAERDAALARIAELEARAEEVSEDEGWHVGGAWGDYGEVVVPLRILSYVIDGKLDEKIVSTDPGYALTYAEQVARANEAEARIAEAAKLHRRRDDLEYRWGGGPVCDGCGDEDGWASKWPCPTAIALGLNEGENND